MLPGRVEKAVPGFHFLQVDRPLRLELAVLDKVDEAGCQKRLAGGEFSFLNVLIKEEFLMVRQGDEAALAAEVFFK